MDVLELYRNGNVPTSDVRGSAIAGRALRIRDRTSTTTRPWNRLEADRVGQNKGAGRPQHGRRPVLRQGRQAGHDGHFMTIDKAVVKPS